MLIRNILCLVHFRNMNIRRNLHIQQFIHFCPKGKYRNVYIELIKGNMLLFEFTVSIQHTIKTTKQVLLKINPKYQNSYNITIAWFKKRKKNINMEIKNTHHIKPPIIGIYIQHNKCNKRFMDDCMLHHSIALS